MQTYCRTRTTPEQIADALTGKQEERNRVFSSSGIDEHFFTRKHGCATTFCDLKNTKVDDVVLGRSEAEQQSLTSYVVSHPLCEVVYRFKQRLCWLLLKKHRTRKPCKPSSHAFYAPYNSVRLFTPGPKRLSPCGASPQQRHHRRFPHQNGSPPAASLWLPKLSELSIES